jgi:hypothetical protein
MQDQVGPEIEGAFPRFGLRVGPGTQAEIEFRFPLRYSFDFRIAKRRFFSKENHEEKKALKKPPGKI